MKKRIQNIKYQLSLVEFWQFIMQEYAAFNPFLGNDCNTHNASTASITCQGKGQCWGRRDFYEHKVPENTNWLPSRDILIV